MNLFELNREFENCDCGKEHKCPVKHIKIGRGVLGELCELCSGYSEILFVFDENTRRVCGERVVELLASKKSREIVVSAPAGDVVIPNEDAIAEIERELTDTTDLIVGVGSGVINDLCKYVSFMHDLPYFIVATAPSMDGYASNGAAMILSGMKVTVSTRPPLAIIGDTEILKDAPLDMIRAGYGDVVGKFSCLNDWQLAALVRGEYFCQKVFDRTLDCAKDVSKMADALLSRDENAVGALFEALVVVGVLMSYVNSSRPASGSEHHLSHFFEITGILNHAAYFSHGIDVLFSAYYTQKIREELLSMDLPCRYTRTEKQEYEGQIQRIYGALAKEIFELQDKVGFYSEDRSEVYRSRFGDIKAILSRAPSSEEIKEKITEIGLSLSDFEAMYGKEKIEDAIFFAKDLKDRYTVLWMYYDLTYGG